MTLRDPSAWGNLGNVLKSQGKMEGAEQAYRNALYYRSNMADMLYNLWVFLITLIVAFNIFVKHWPQILFCLFVFNLLMRLCIYNHLIVLKREWMIGKTLLSHVYIDQSSSERKYRLVFNSPGRCPPDSVINDAVLVWGENTKHRPILTVWSNVCGLRNCSLHIYQLADVGV